MTKCFKHSLKPDFSTFQSASSSSPTSLLSSRRLHQPTNQQSLGEIRCHFSVAVISFSLTFVTAYTRWLFSPRALRCRKVPEGERIVSAARNCVILYCTLGLGFLVNTILGKIDRTFYVFIFDADWIRSMFSQQCSGTLHFQCCKWTFRFSEKMMSFFCLSTF